MDDEQYPVPYCPKCKQPAHHVLVRVSSVLCELNLDGTIGRAVRHRKTPGEKRVFLCVGKHKWEDPDWVEEDEEDG